MNKLTIETEARVIPPELRVGQIYRNTKSGYLYIVGAAAICGQHRLYNLETGCHYSDSGMGGRDAEFQLFNGKITIEVK